MISLRQVAGGTPYAAYAYSYPHKTAYRPLRPPRALQEAWNAEGKDSLFLYLHVPFCEMRCGFCNLFTTANPSENLSASYVCAMHRQARRVRDAVGPARFARMAIGGGTPTYLSAGQLEQVLQISREFFGVDGKATPISVETSPRTADSDKLQLLRDYSVQRISMGVQSMVEAEVNASGRAQKNAWVQSAIERIRQLDFPTLNLDLIYGLPGQTVSSWLRSLELSLDADPEELYLYPLYVRPITGLQRWGREAEDSMRLACYREGRSLLLSRGYVQQSMRMFQKPSPRKSAGGPVYCCQEDGMLGLGCGARSYTQALHYSTDYAVGADGVRQIIADYIAKPEQDFDFADYGCELDDAEQRRRFLIKSLLRIDGLAPTHYRQQFGADVRCDFPELKELEEAGYLETAGSILRLTPAGLERSDAIGPWLYSPAMQQRMAAYKPR